MIAEIRPARHADLPSMAELLHADAERRHAHDPALWAFAADARAKVAEAVTFALTAEKQPFRQIWLVALVGDRLVGLLHAMHLPVPPIYAGKWGDPGLILPETHVAQDAPAGTVGQLVDAAEAQLRAAGARLLLASHVCGDEWLGAFQARGYEPLTLYLSKSGLRVAPEQPQVRAASDADIDAIVALSAEHRSVLHRLDPFWAPHPEADARFANWMRKSLTFSDRDMLVSGPPGAVEGYAIAQPASRLHFPPAHDISATGVIDDFFHRTYADPVRMQGGEAAPHALLRAAESSFAARGIGTAFVVCPAAWASKIAVLEGAGYRQAMVWMIRREGVRPPYSR